jgi:hypothetical protein
MVIAKSTFEAMVLTIALLCSNVLAPVWGSTQGKIASNVVLAYGCATHSCIATHVSPIALQPRKPSPLLLNNSRKS